MLYYSISLVNKHMHKLHPVHFQRQFDIMEQSVHQCWITNQSNVFLVKEILKYAIF